jgi:hypothetical protein
MYNAGVVAVNSIVLGLAPGSNPASAIYNTSVVKSYNATNSLYILILTNTMPALH